MQNSNSYMLNSLTIHHRNSLNRKTGAVGFFSYFFQVLDNINYCVNNNLKPIIKLNKQYYSGEWEDYFECINDGKVIGTNIDSNYFLSTDFIVNMETMRPHLILWELLSNNNIVEANRHRKKVNTIIKSYITPTQEIFNMVSEYSKYITNNTLGIHVRATDYNFNNLQPYFDAIDEIVDNFNAIYVASDSLMAINEIYNRYKNVYFLKSNLKTTEMAGDWIGSSMNETNLLQHGKEVLCESLLLSKCKKIICINSNVPAAAAYFNPDIDINLIHRSPNGG